MSTWRLANLITDIRGFTLSLHIGSAVVYSIATKPAILTVRGFESWDGREIIFLLQNVYRHSLRVARPLLEMLPGPPPLAKRVGRKILTSHLLPLPK